MKINIQHSKIKEKPLNLEPSCNSMTLKQCQSIDFSYSSITDFKQITLFTALALGLISNSYFAYAEENTVTSNLQAVAESYAQEIGDVRAEEHWARVEFGTTYIDPVVVVEGSIANSDDAYVVGIRNIDAMGFEVSLKNCNNSTGIPVQESVNYAVIEKSQLPLTEDGNTQIRQQFSWGECATATETRGIS